MSFAFGRSNYHTRMEAVPSVDSIIEGLPQKPVKIRGLPNYHTLNTL
jgi:hypothetical protein